MSQTTGPQDAAIVAPSPIPSAGTPKKNKTVNEDRIVHPLFVKTRLCRFNGMAICTRGDLCKFAHTKDERQPLPDLKRTKLCTMRGKCTNRHCGFAHTWNDLRLLETATAEERLVQRGSFDTDSNESTAPSVTTPDRAVPFNGTIESKNNVTGKPRSQKLAAKCARTKICKFYLAGCCSRQDACTFAHGDGDLLPPPDFSYTKLCPGLVSDGVCRDTTCTYAHHNAELRSGVWRHTAGDWLAQAPPRAEARAFPQEQRVYSRAQQLQQQQQHQQHQQHAQHEQQDAFQYLMHTQSMLGQQQQAWTLLPQPVVQTSWVATPAVAESVAFPVATQMVVHTAALEWRKSATMLRRDLVVPDSFWQPQQATPLPVAFLPPQPLEQPSLPLPQLPVQQRLEDTLEGLRSDSEYSDQSDFECPDTPRSSCGDAKDGTGMLVSVWSRDTTHDSDGWSRSTTEELDVRHWANAVDASPGTRLRTQRSRWADILEDDTDEDDMNVGSVHPGAAHTRKIGEDAVVRSRS